MTRLVALYRLFLRQQATTGRFLLAGGFAVLFIVVAFALSQADLSTADRLEAPIGIAAGLGLGLMIPIVALVISSSALGDLVEDETLVYLWHRPIPHWMLSLAAWGSSITMVAPATVIPIAVGTALASHGNEKSIVAVTLASALAVIAYSGLFVLLGLIVKRALIWGLIYVFIWEQFVARVGGGAAKLSVLNYLESVLSRMTDIDWPQAERPLYAAVLVPCLVGLGAVMLAGWRLDRTDVA